MLALRLTWTGGADQIDPQRRSCLILALPPRAAWRPREREFAWVVEVRPPGSIWRRRQHKYLNNIVEQDHRAIQPVTKPMLNFKSFRAAGSVLAGVEPMHMIRKGKFAIYGADAMSVAEQFYTMAGMIRPV